MVMKYASGTPDAGGPKITGDLTAAMVKVDRDSAIDVNALYSGVIAVADDFYIEYRADGAPDTYPAAGYRLG